MTSTRRAAQGNRRHVNSVAKYILSKKASVQREGTKCTKCGGRNHFEVTYTTPTRKVYSPRDESSDDSDVEYITSIVAQLEMIHGVMQEHYPKVIYTEMC